MTSQKHGANETVDCNDTAHDDGNKGLGCRFRRSVFTFEGVVSYTFMTSSGRKGPIPAIPIPAFAVPYAAPRANTKRAG